MQVPERPVRSEAFYLGPPVFDEGRRHVLLQRPADSAPIRGAIVHAPPWGEEMNKSRRMVSLQSRALASAGWAVMQFDLLGCGDSSGEFRDATWEGWEHDVACAARWLAAEAPGPLWFWGLRSGCLLAAAATRRFDRAQGLLLWQPVTAGRTVLQSFLLVEAAAAMAGNAAAATLSQLRRSLAEGGTVEVAGYELSSRLAEGLDSSLLTQPPAGLRCLCLEVSARADTGISLPLQTLVRDWTGAGVPTTAVRVEGPSFWQTTEIEVAPTLIEATLQAMLPEVPA